MEDAEKTKDWWDVAGRVPEPIKQEVASRIQKELDAGVTKRSEDELDYTTFGELNEIIKANYDFFQGIFNSKKALGKVANSFNTLRNSIAHCCPLSEHEKTRLQITIGDWFRLME